MTRLKNLKRVAFVMVVSALCTASVGCSHVNRQEQENNITKNEKEETAISQPIPSTEDIVNSGKDDTDAEKQLEIEKICG